MAIKEFGKKDEKKVASDPAAKTAKAAAKQAAVTENAKAAEQVVAEQTVVEAGDAQITGSKSNTLEFVASLGDPSVIDKTTNSKTNQTIERPTTVGYQFKSSIDLEVPDVQPGADLKNNLMSFTGDPTKTRHVAAGEVFSLSLFETGMLISRDEYNGRALGGTMPVYCAYANVSKSGSTGTVQTTASATKIPRISLRALKKQETDPGIKDFPFVDVLTFTSVPNGKTMRKQRTIVPGFEKFAPLCQEAVRTAGTPKAATTQRNQGAVAFLQMAQKAAHVAQ